MKLSLKILFGLIWLSSCSNPFGSKSFINIDSAVFDWSNKDFDFGNQQVGSSSLQTFYFENNGNLDGLHCGPVGVT